MKKFSALLCAVLLGVIFGGCATQTPYGPYGSNGGYRDVQLDKNTMKVFFVANEFTTKDIVDIYTLYRCAEVTVEKGYDYFEFVSNELHKESSTINTPGTYSGITTVHVNKGVATVSSFGTYTPGPSIQIDQYTGSALIKMYKGSKPKHKANAYDAKELMSYLEPNIKRK